MLSLLERLLPSYLVAKAKGQDCEEYEKIPPHLRTAFIAGSPQEAVEALEEIAALRRHQRQPSLSEAARELLYDARACFQNKNN